MSWLKVSTYSYVLSKHLLVSAWRCGSLTHPLKMSMSLLVALSLFRQLVAVEDIKFSNILVVPCWVVFAGVVGTVEDAFAPKIFELALCIAAF